MPGVMPLPLHVVSEPKVHSGCGEGARVGCGVGWAVGEGVGGVGEGVGACVCAHGSAAQAGCDSCDVGQYQDQKGAVSGCKKCTAGRYQPFDLSMDSSIEKEGAAGHRSMG